MTCGSASGTGLVAGDMSVADRHGRRLTHSDAVIGPAWPLFGLVNLERSHSNTGPHRSHLPSPVQTRPSTMPETVDPSAHVWPSRDDSHGWTLAPIIVFEKTWWSFFRLDPLGSGQPQMISINGKNGLIQDTKHKLWSEIDKHRDSELLFISSETATEENHHFDYWQSFSKKLLSEPWPSRRDLRGWTMASPPNLCTSLFRMAPSGSGHPQLISCDGVDGIWAKDPEDFWEKIAALKDTPLMYIQPIEGGELHREKFGITGYEPELEHWVLYVKHLLDSTAQR
ncbi:uncharacterized protein BJ171DRAFT_177470 [Polychytrium aggregatum]|uniref:uncharacterized protein n=1 Tax=Polychytrium aggregatum TaxID=110093 RepID=UPI0022FF3B9D|nr:uncharacterized protein BJ171DRAFT_177470 [Polychytrium aggregatum]KAI9202573.1 hypothetical protein BJ171DRAFT_177470 [Polychytrium aggregatum]